MRPDQNLALLALLILGAAAFVACDDTDDSIGSACRIDDDCADDQQCSGGECVDRRACVCPALYEPVCGVNGRTYGNECEASCDGVAVASEGRCPGPDGGVRDGGAIDLGLPDLGGDGGGSDGGGSDGGNDAGSDGGTDDGGSDGGGSDAALDAALDAAFDAALDLGLTLDGAPVQDAMADSAVEGDI